jgi:hypothetical protein
MSRRHLAVALMAAWGGLGSSGLPAQTVSPPESHPRSEPTARRIALVVGNARYPTAALNNPENDARLVAKTLAELGFEVELKVNLRVKEFRAVLRDFSRRLQNEDVSSVFFYAGHGVQIGGRNYLLPVDLNIRDEEEIRDEAVDVDDLFISRLERARSRVRIVILDACRDNPFATHPTRTVRAVGGGLAEMSARGALIAFSSAPGATAEDGPPGSNSVYTRHLVQEMRREGLEVEQMFKAVRVKVLRDTSERQMPWVNTSLIEDFSFNPGRSGGESSRPAPSARPLETPSQTPSQDSSGRPTQRPQPVRPSAVPAQPENLGKPDSGRASKQASERCSALLQRAALGTATPAELSQLQSACR